MSLRSNSMHITAGGPWTHRWHGPTKTHLCRRENVPAFFRHGMWLTREPPSRFSFQLQLLCWISRTSLIGEIVISRFIMSRFMLTTLGSPIAQGWWTQEFDQACTRTSLSTSYLHKKSAVCVWASHLRARTHTQTHPRSHIHTLTQTHTLCTWGEL